MAIPEGRLSTEVKSDQYLEPDDRFRVLVEDYEAGPIALYDTSGGLFNQTWKLTWNGGSDEFIVTPEVTGSPSTVITQPNVVQCSLAFDQNANPSIFWVDTSGDAHLYWYDTLQQENVVSDFPTIFHGMLSLDDKRYMQAGTSDIMLWYTKVVGQRYDLFTRLQRDRYLVEYEMQQGVFPYVRNAGMHKGLRGQILLTSSPI